MSSIRGFLGDSGITSDVEYVLKSDVKIPVFTVS